MKCQCFLLLFDIYPVTTLECCWELPGNKTPTVKWIYVNTMIFHRDIPLQNKYS